MQEMRLAQILLTLNGRILRPAEDVVVTGVSADSRLTRRGDLFFALVSERDGHAFVNDAARAGAAAAVVSRRIDVDLPMIEVPDTLKALGDLARAYRLTHDIPIVAVTGSVGKTTTKEMIGAVLERKYSTLKSEKNYNNDIGVPLTLLRLTPDHQAAVLEMAMRGSGEIYRLVNIARPTIAVITNVGLSHIGRLGSLEAVADAKAEILEGLPSNGLAVLNGDDERFELVRSRRVGRTVVFGTGEFCDIRATDVRIHPDGHPTATVLTPKGRTDLDLVVVGEHNVWNALAAIAVGIELGVPLDEARSALAVLKPPTMRSNLISSPLGFTVINDAYNAGPASMASAVRTLAAMEASRRIAVLGDMLELGDYADRAHLDIGRIVGERGIDQLVTVGEMSRRIAEGAVDAGLAAANILSYDSGSEVASDLKPRLRAGDLVLVKGSRGMKMETVVEDLLGER